MKKEKSISESLSELYVVAESFVKIMELNKISSHFTISGASNDPVYSELKIAFYQPSDERSYCMKKKYTFINIGGIEFGQYGHVKHKIGITASDIDEITKEAKKVYDLFKVFSFGSLYEKRMLEIKNETKKHNRILRDLKNEYKKMVNELERYK
jgi:hypothetical protein